MIFFLFVLTLSFSAISIADAEPAEYYIQIIIEEFDTLNFQEESVNASFWVIITSDDVDFTEETPVLQFPDGVVLPLFQESQYTSISPNKFVTKVEGEFGMVADYHNYPYELVKLPIILQIHDKDISEVILRISPDHNENDIQTHGFVFFNSSSYVQTETWHDKKTYSQFVVDTTWQRPVKAIFLQEILPLLIIGAITIFVLRFQPQNLEVKAGSAIGLIFALVAFHGLVIEEALPQLTYLTFEERLIIVDYTLIAYVFVEVLIQQKYNKGDKDRIRKINNKMTLLLPAVIAVVVASILFL